MVPPTDASRTGVQLGDLHRDLDGGGGGLHRVIYGAIHAHCGRVGPAPPHFHLVFLTYSDPDPICGRHERPVRHVLPQMLRMPQQGPVFYRL